MNSRVISAVSSVASLGCGVVLCSGGMAMVFMRLRHQVGVAADVIAAPAAPGQCRQRQPPAGAMEPALHTSCLATGTRVFRGQPQIVGHQPEPAGVGMVAVRRDGAHGDAALSGLADVGGRLEFRAAHVDARSLARPLSSVSTAGIAFELHPRARSCSRETPAPGSAAARAWARLRRRPAGPAGWPGGARCAAPFLRAAPGASSP